MSKINYLSQCIEEVRKSGLLVLTPDECIKQVESSGLLVMTQQQFEDSITNVAEAYMEDTPC
jgi:hypothetical protein